MAKSTSMMPFFLTMPISKMIPMIPIIDKSMPPIRSASSGTDTGRRERGQYRQRVHEALIQHAKNDIDDNKRSHDQNEFIRQRVLERLSVSGELTGDRARHTDLLGPLAG